jgi:hypothetical protein
MLGHGAPIVAKMKLNQFTDLAARCSRAPSLYYCLTVLLFLRGARCGIAMTRLSCCELIGTTIFIDFFNGIIWSMHYLDSQRRAP